MCLYNIEKKTRHEKFCFLFFKQQQATFLKMQKKTGSKDHLKQKKVCSGFIAGMFPIFYWFTKKKNFLDL